MNGREYVREPLKTYCGYLCYGNMSNYEFEVGIVLPQLATSYAYL